MRHRLLLPALTIVFGGFILFVSVIHASEISFDVDDLATPLPLGPTMAEHYYVDYDLPQASSSSTLPFLQQIQAIGDKLHIYTTLSPQSRAQAMLDQSNRRVVLGELFIREGKIEQGLIALSKSQQYLDESLEIFVGSDDKSFRTKQILKEIALASLKHRERMENLSPLMPDESRTIIVQNVDRSKLVFNGARLALEQLGESAPLNPFDQK